MSRRIWAAVLGLIPAVAFGQVSFGPALTGTTAVVNNGPGDQTDPHVSCDSVAYTSDVSGVSQIRYHDLRVHTDQAIPNNGAFDSLSDVSGNKIVFTRTIPGQSAILVFDTAAPATPPVELDPTPGSERRAAAIGGNTVAWQDFTFSSSLLDAEIVAYDLTSRTARRLTTDGALDRSPAVSPDGNVIVFAKCDTSGNNCDIYKTVKGAGGFPAPVAVTGAAGDESLPDTNGTVIVYGSIRGTEQDVFFQPVAGGAEQQLILPGEDVNPNVAGTLIAFEHLEPGAFNRDLLLYDMATRTAYRLTNTPSLDETLNDISVCADGQVRVVYTVREGSGTGASYNVYAFSFRLSAPPPPCSNGNCANPGSRPLLSDFDVKRTNGPLNYVHKHFPGKAGPGLLCVDNNKATSGWVFLNHRSEICPSAFHTWTTSIEKKVSVKNDNSVTALIGGQPGKSYRVRVYGNDPACAVPSSALADEDDELGEAGRGLSADEVRTLPGLAAVSLDNGSVDLTGLFHDAGAPEEPGVAAQSCASTSGDPLAIGLLALLGMWAARRGRRTSR